MVRHEARTQTSHAEGTDGCLLIRSHTEGSTKQSLDTTRQAVSLQAQLTSMTPSGSMPDGPSEPDWSRPPCEGSSAKSPSGAALAPQSLKGVERAREKGNVRVRSQAEHAHVRLWLGGGASIRVATESQHKEEVRRLPHGYHTSECDPSTRETRGPRRTMTTHIQTKKGTETVRT